MRELTFDILSKSYRVSLEEDLAMVVEERLKKSGFELDAKNTPQQLLSAYFELCEELVNSEKELKTVLKSLEKLSL